MFKRIFDFLVSLVGLLLLFPLLAFIALLIKIKSPGPVFFRGIRTGKNGKTFRILKFRTMVTNASLQREGTTAKGDPRITPIGKILRRYKLDELPQLWNVLVGEMSLVGPRPELPRYTNEYNRHEQKILSVLPGITDFSSIEFHSLDEVVGASQADEAYEKLVLPHKNQLRLRYVEKQSLKTDLEILGKTFFVLTKKVLRRDKHATN